MDLSIQQVIRERKVTGVRHTHVTMGQNQGKYEFNQDQLEEFWSIYMKTVENNTKIAEKKSPENKKRVHLCIAEKGQNYLPILADIDIKIKETDDTSLQIDGDTGLEIIHTDEHIDQVREAYQDVLRKTVEGCTDVNLICVVLEKPLYRINKNNVTYVKHGFHLHFPYTFISKKEQENHIIPRVKNMIKDMETFKDIGVEDSGTLIDSSCCKVPWLMYGASKEEGLEPYKVSKIYGSDGEVMSMKEAFKGLKVYDKKEKPIKIPDDKYELYLPRILSILPYCKEVLELRSGLTSPIKDQMIARDKAIKEKQGYRRATLEEDMVLARKLMPLLSDYRSDDQNEWMTVGWMLFCISDGSAEGLDLWCTFSAKNEEKYDEGVCIHKWERMIKREYTIGTLKHFARLDSPEKYKDIVKEQAVKYVHEAINGSHNDIAKILFAEHGLDFVCSSITSKTFYHFIDNKWEQDEEGVYLRTKISNEIVQKFVLKGQEYIKELGNCGDDKGTNAMVASRIKAVQKMIVNLKSAPYKKSVMSEVAEVFYDKRFKDKLNTNPTLFPFKNGVFDLTENKFRDGIPEDFISKTCSIDYKEFHDTDDEVQDVYDYLEKVFPDKSVRKYFMDVSSDIFLGGNHQKHVYFWIGEGDNSKSVMQGLFEKMLGKLAIKFNTTVITGKKVQNGAANAELARAGDGVRLATLEEPDGDEMINIGVMKNLSGNDSYFARDLHEKGKDTKEITPMFKLVFICNKLPKIKNCDKAVKNRVRVIPFESTFVKPDDPNPAPDTFEEQLRQKRFPIDPKFAQKIPKMLQAFAWVLLKHRLTIKERVEPEKVRLATASYMKSNDVYRQFIETCIIEDEKKKLSLTELYNSFKNWFRESGRPISTVALKDDVEEYFTKLWDEPLKGKIWKGYRLRVAKDDGDTGEDEEDADVVDEEDDNRKNLPKI
jgi:P4 family phage/plasmid primase-like protien